MIPEQWEEGVIGTLIDSLEAGVSVNSEDRHREANEVGVLKTSAVTYGIFDPLSHKAVLSSESNRVRVNPRKDNIIISRMNTLALVGASAYVEDDYPALFLPDRLWQTRRSSRPFSMRWLSYVLATDMMRRRIASGATGTSGSMKNISQSTFLNLRILIPPLPEQHKIAEILGTWDEAIRLTADLIAAKQQRKKGLMQRLLSGEVRFPGFAGRPWINTTLGSMAQIVMGQSPSSINYNREGEGLPLIQGNADITDRRTTPRNFTTEITKESFPGDIILSVRAPVGETAISEHHACIGRGVCAIRAERIDKHFLFQLLVSIEQTWQTYAQGSTFTAINSADIKQLQLNIPSDNGEQRKIASLLRACDREINLLQQKLAALQQQKKGLMQRLLTGAVRVKISDQE